MWIDINTSYGFKNSKKSVYFFKTDTTKRKIYLK